LTKPFEATANLAPVGRLRRAKAVIESRWLGFFALYVLDFAMLISVVSAANQQQLLLKEEASAGHVAPRDPIVPASAPHFRHKFLQLSHLRIGAPCVRQPLRRPAH
jgi:hypothetical protein